MKRESAKDIGQRVKAVRRALRYQQKEVAAALNIAAGYLSDIESGKANPGPEFFVKFAREYNVNLNYIFLGIGDMLLDADRKMTVREFSFDEEVDSIEKLNWLMEHSSFFKNAILSLASKTLLENEPLVRKSLQKNLPAKEEDQD